jgi:hypothetical protein
MLKSLRATMCWRLAASRNAWWVTVETNKRRDHLQGTKVAIKTIDRPRIELTRPLLLEFKRVSKSS